MWAIGRNVVYGQAELKPAGKGVEVETVNGHLVKYYN